MQESLIYNAEKFSQQLQNWYTSPAGQILSKELENKLEQILPNLFGYYALQLGALGGDTNFLASSSISKKICMTLKPNQGHIAGNPLALPFPQDTLDLIVLPHTLDFSHDPHQVLREVHRVLISEGHLVLIAFNPLSMMGLCKFLLMRSKKVPWVGHFYSARRLRDWFALLDFTVLKTQHIGLRPPIQNLRMQQRLEVLNKFKRVGLGRLGGIQIFVAQKRVLTMTPRPQPWRPHRRILPVNVAEPSTRQASHVRTSRYLH